MEKLTEEFINIWNDNCNMLSNSLYFDKFINIINKLKKRVSYIFKKKKYLLNW
jgi:hypothetical protein